MTKLEYNGWTNYETWNVKLRIDNDQGTQEHFSEAAREIYERSEAGAVMTREEEAATALADMLQEEHEEALPKLEGFAADLLGAAMSEVNWHEIAASLIEDAKEELATV